MHGGSKVSRSGGGEDDEAGGEGGEGHGPVVAGQYVQPVPHALLTHPRTIFSTIKIQLCKVCGYK